MSEYLQVKGHWGRLMLAMKWYLKKFVSWLVYRGLITIWPPVAYSMTARLRSVVVLNLGLAWQHHLAYSSASWQWRPVPKMVSGENCGWKDRSTTCESSLLEGGRSFGFTVFFYPTTARRKAKFHGDLGISLRQNMQNGFRNHIRGRSHRFSEEIKWDAGDAVSLLLQKWLKLEVDSHLNSLLSGCYKLTW